MEQREKKEGVNVTEGRQRDMRGVIREGVVQYTLPCVSDVSAAERGTRGARRGGYNLRHRRAHLDGGDTFSFVCVSYHSTATICSWSLFGADLVARLVPRALSVRRANSICYTCFNRHLIRLENRLPQLSTRDRSAALYSLYALHLAHLARTHYSKSRLLRFG